MEKRCQCVKTEITSEQWEKIDEIIARYKTKPGALIPVLEQVQGVAGFLSAQVQRRIAEGLNVSPSMVYGVVSFYSFFTMVPRGRHLVRVCMGTACYVKRSDEVLEKIKQELKIEVGGMSEDGRFSLESVRCLGACGLAPVVVVDNVTHGAIDSVKIMNIVNQYE
ncbi:NAD(P)H-dependent oxidoreductase subunit E [bacterium]|nr:NAD(P)H-dependent oxidoreductase subunit E [bacterium]MBU1154003.1 NAD(P)H-dependent oxidoreductase subunit E [bacterium]MBU1782637.1 NAD(P)H-dependent oxidoreductase subunit E [bacterium]